MQVPPVSILEFEKICASSSDITFKGIYMQVPTKCTLVNSDVPRVNPLGR